MRESAHIPQPALPSRQIGDSLLALRGHGVWRKFTVNFFNFRARVCVCWLKYVPFWQQEQSFGDCGLRLTEILCFKGACALSMSSEL